MKTSTNPLPHIAPAWQAAHLAGLGVGGKALIVAACEPQPEIDGEWIWLALPSGGKLGQHRDDHESIARLCKTYGPFGPVGGVLKIGDDLFRVLSIDLRRVGTMTEEEAMLWGCSGIMATEAVRRRRKEFIATPLMQSTQQWNADNPAHPWSDAWSWFALTERIERCQRKNT